MSRVADNQNTEPSAAKRYPVGIDGFALALPPRGLKRWLPRYKAEVVAAVRGGLLSVEQACERYELTVDELLAWQRSIDADGLSGLRATRRRICTLPEERAAARRCRGPERIIAALRAADRPMTGRELAGAAGVAPARVSTWWRSVGDAVTVRRGRRGLFIALTPTSEVAA